MYLSVAAVDSAVQNLAASFPALCSLVTLPYATVENRTSHALRLGSSSAGSQDVFMIVGGHHAREWGSCEILVNLATDLLSAYTNGAGLAYGGQTYTAAQIKSLLDSMNLVIFPLINPDGRNFSQTVNALWRKNRNTAYTAGSTDPARVGVDLNRNYDFLFDFNTAFGQTPVVSDDTASDVYHGPSAFSEAETQNVRWLLDAFPTTRWFVDVHSFSNDMLYSWGDDNDQTTDPSMNFLNPAYDHQRGITNGAYAEYIQGDDLALVQRLGNKFASSLLAVRGKSYTVKSSYDLYPTSGCSDDWAFARHRVNPSKGKTYGWVIEWGDPPIFQPAWSEMQNIILDVSSGLIGMCLAAPCGDGLIAVSANTPAVIFNDVPVGVTTTRAIVFSVESCSAVTLNIVSGPSVSSGPGTFTAPLGNPPPLPAAASDAERLVYAWVSFTGTSAGSTSDGTITVQCVQTGQNFVIPIHANTIAQPAVASMLVLDQSGSMDWASGVPGKKRIDILHAAAPNFVNLLPDVDGVGVVAFDQDAYLRQNVQAGAAGRAAANTAIANHQTNVQGSTSIGDGVELAHNTLAPLGGYASKAVVVFTDGEENTYKFIKDVMSSIDDRVFAIGLGTVQQVNPVALNQLVNNTGGYILLTDQLGPNDQLRLPKYFVQIAAGVSNAEVVVDPDDVLAPGAVASIPLWINEGDYGADVILLSPAPWVFEFVLETPDGIKIDGANLAGVVGAEFKSFSQMAYYRLSFPVVAANAAAQVGRWKLWLRVNPKTWRKYLAGVGEGGNRVGVPYSAMVHARSSVNLRAYLTQSSYVPGAAMRLRAVVTELGLPAAGSCAVTAQITRPDGTQVLLTLQSTAPGIFEAADTLPINGLYPVRFRVQGKTVRGSPYTREQIRNGMAWAGGDDPLPSGHGSGSPDWCGLVQCLLGDAGLRKWLKEAGVNVEGLTKCIESKICRDKPVPR
jgi:murein tripeptide amidase MpaA